MTVSCLGMALRDSILAINVITRSIIILLGYSGRRFINAYLFPTNKNKPLG